VQTLQLLSNDPPEPQVGNWSGPWWFNLIAECRLPGSYNALFASAELLQGFTRPARLKHEVD
jgi:hypothetical protein